MPAAPELFVRAQEVLDVVLSDRFPRLALSDRDLDPMVPASIDEKHEVRLTFLDLGPVGLTCPRRVDRVDC
ncbi:hypothetical protein D3Y57_01210 (plasmid) [Sphingomonas paeninsulae]|uniref:Uncharacterized protein n=1 Tax=Sphingomonas paeninsulae TaxID=2319844 RepID=A0A494T600_SPHPE|nr:hypothetical protein D3Y57_01210 [Sphingomonas paeninsulae]